MWEQMMAFLKSFFIYPGLNWDLMLIGIGLGIVFGRRFSKGTGSGWWRW
jgi:hypothetical protein